MKGRKNAGTMNDRKKEIKKGYNWRNTEKKVNTKETKRKMKEK